MKPTAINRLLLPLSGLYGLVTDLRNWLFNNQLKEVYRASIRTVSVGNLTVGGTGKTPMVEFLIKWYLNKGGADAYQAVTLSRGYGRKTSGFRVAGPDDTATTLGDEPLQVYRKFGRQVRVCVGERRADAIQAIERIYPNTRLIILDDAFQHRAVQPDVNLLLTDYARLFVADHPFPAGRLRERRQGARRADAVIVTKCPVALPATEQHRIAGLIRQYARPDVPVFFAGMAYQQPVPFSGSTSPALTGRVVLVSGLANADPLDEYVQTKYTLLSHRRYADHYAYTRAELERVMAELPAGASVLTTEKDWVKLDALLTPAERAQWPLYYLPVGTQLLDGSDRQFDQFLTEQILKNP